MSDANLDQQVAAEIRRQVAQVKSEARRHILFNPVSSLATYLEAGELEPDAEPSEYASRYGWYPCDRVLQRRGDYL